MTSLPARSPDHLPFFDGLRGYSILMVIAGHFELLPFSFASFGVTLFFFVSGFMITRLLIFEIRSSGSVSIARFYLRRIFRLYPALLLMIIVVISVALIHGYRIVWPDIIAGLFYLSNYYIAFFHPASDLQYPFISNILWSLAVEEHFYLLFPWIFLLLYPRGKLLIRIIMALLVFALLIRTVIFFTSSNDYWINYLTTQSRYDSILYGCLLAMLLYKATDAAPAPGPATPALVLVGLALMCSGFLINTDYFQSALVYTIQGIGIGVFVLALCQSQTSSWVRAILGNRIIVFIGKLSYSLYLFHWVALKIAGFYYPSINGQWLLLASVLTIVLSLASWYLVETPFIRLRRRYGSTAGSR